MNNNIEKFNNGKRHQPIYKARIFELGSKFNIGENGHKKDKFVEAAKGTNLFFAIYWNADKQKREFETIPLNVVIENLKNGHTPANPTNENGSQLMFTLSPNDLVYVPTVEEQNDRSLVNFGNLSKNQTDRIYKMVSSSGTQCFYIKSEVATSIANKLEFSTLNKMEKTIDGTMIKDICWKLTVNRIGQIIQVVK